MTKRIQYTVNTSLNVVGTIIRDEGVDVPMNTYLPVGLVNFTHASGAPYTLDCSITKVLSFKYLEEAPNLTPDDIEELKQFFERIRVQDNRTCQTPVRFLLQDEVEVFDPRDCIMGEAFKLYIDENNDIWRGSTCEEILTQITSHRHTPYSEEQTAQLLTTIKGNHYNMRRVFQTVTSFLTEHAAMQYLKQHKYRYSPNARIITITVEEDAEAQLVHKLLLNVASLLKSS